MQPVSRGLLLCDACQQNRLHARLLLSDSQSCPNSVPSWVIWNSDPCGVKCDVHSVHGRQVLRKFGQQLVDGEDMSYGSRVPDRECASHELFTWYVQYVGGTHVNIELFGLPECILLPDDELHPVLSSWRILRTGECFFHTLCTGAILSRKRVILYALSTRLFLSGRY